MGRYVLVVPEWILHERAVCAQEWEQELASRPLGPRPESAADKLSASVKAKTAK